MEKKYMMTKEKYITKVIGLRIKKMAQGKNITAMELILKANLSMILWRVPSSTRGLSTESILVDASISRRTGAR